MGTGFQTSFRIGIFNANDKHPFRLKKNRDKHPFLPTQVPIAPLHPPNTKNLYQTCLLYNPGGDNKAAS